MKKQENQLSRRDVFVSAGRVAAGAAALTLGTSAFNSASAMKQAKFPWGYVKTDPKEAGQIAYNSWYKRFCCYAVVSGILEPLQKKIGEPYASLPLQAFQWGHGGAVGWGTLCGSLTGAGIATGLIAGHEGEKILNDIIAWYTETKLPIFKPAQPRAKVVNVNASDSPLCHISVGKWMKKENASFNSPARRDRCARLSADIAMKTVSLLNDWAEGKYRPSHGSNARDNGITTQLNCTECHDDNVPEPKM